MTIPDKLITAAAEAIAKALGHNEVSDTERHQAELALAAAFAALPDCNEAWAAVFNARPTSTDEILSALARMAEA